jgi:RNA polymerase sigma-70 factor (ECF subfamily)
MALTVVDGPSWNVQSAVLECIPGLHAFATSLTRDRHQADDLVQASIIRALGAAGQFAPGTNFKAWIFTILRNLNCSERRKRPTRFSSLDELAADEPSVPAPQEASLEFCDFRRAFWQLGAGQREGLLLVGVSGLSYEVAATVCHCSVGTMKSRVSRARRDLKQLLADDLIATRRIQYAAVTGAGLLQALQPAAASPPIVRSSVNGLWRAPLPCPWTSADGPSPDLACSSGASRRGRTARLRLIPLPIPPRTVPPQLRHS